MGTQSTMVCGQELHEDSAPTTKGCDQCGCEYPADAVFFHADYCNGEVCGTCTDENIQLEIEELGLEEFIKRFN